MVLPLLLVLARMCTLLMVCSEQQAVANNCSDGWFGQTCQLQCHCRVGQCNISGECTDNKCQRGYFGPGCQYVDLVYRWKTGNTSNFVYDQDEDTCNPSSSATSIVITLSSEFRFFWMQIHVTSHSESFNFSVTFDHKSGSCVAMRIYIVTDKMLEVTCEMTNDPFTNVTVQGNIVSAVCSIYISGGRNVALKENTALSNKRAHAADKVVDGDTNTTLEKCFNSTIYNMSHWQVTFSALNILTRVTIHQPGTQNLTLQAEGEIRGVVSTPVGLLANGTVADIKLTWMGTMRSLTISGNPVLGLQLCEVEVFAETSCNIGFYGLQCKDKCTCTDDKICSMVSGTCGKGCHESYNYRCEQYCSRNCNQSNCLPGAKYCDKCIKGYTNPNCSNKCPNDTFGINCSRQCSVGCVDNCYHVDGNCTTCYIGYNGATCEECPKGTFGINCSQQCSVGCDGNCNHVDGNCTKCHKGYNGTTCEECPPSTWGNYCSASCPDNCGESFCNTTNGHCFDCKFGKIGKSCRDCVHNRYGPNCTQNCSVACFNSSCLQPNGDCINCSTGYHGTACTPCPRSKYGDNCSSACSMNCLNQDCSHITGRCMSCVKGKMAPTCSDPSPNMLVQALILVGFTIIMIPFCVCIRSLSSRMTQEKLRRASLYQERDSSQPGESDGAEELSVTETGLSSSGSTTAV